MNVAILALLFLVGCGAPRPPAPPEREASLQLPPEREASPPLPPLSAVALPREPNKGIETKPLLTTVHPDDGFFLALRTSTRGSSLYDQTFVGAWTSGLRVTIAKAATRLPIWTGETAALLPSNTQQTNDLGLTQLRLFSGGATSAAGTAPWLSQWPRLADGRYIVQIKQREQGEARRHYETHYEFEISVDAAAQPASQALEYATAAAKAANPSGEFRTGTESGFVPSLVIETAQGERNVRFAVSNVTRWGFDLITVKLSLDGKVLAVTSAPINTCLAADTWLRLASGEIRPIDQIQQGDMLWGYDPELRQRVPVTVQFVEAFTKRTPLVTLPGGLRVTPEHPVFAAERFSAAGDIASGQALMHLQGQVVAPRQLTAQPSISDVGVHTVYNVGVDGPHTYFANDILVHNKDRGYHAPLDDAWLFMWDNL